MHSIIKSFSLVLLMIGEGTCSGADLPDPNLTPGTINPDVTQENIASTICVKGFTNTIRPPAAYTNALKKQQLREYGFADTHPSHYEEDHLIPLSLGGAPTDPRNLRPQARDSEYGADKKDQLEFVLYKNVCKGRLSLANAQQVIATDWISAWKRYAEFSSQNKSRGQWKRSE